MGNVEGQGNKSETKEPSVWELKTTHPNFLASTRRGKFPGKMPRGLSVLCCGDGAKINGAIPTKLTTNQRACFETHLFIKHQNQQSLKTQSRSPSFTNSQSLNQREGTTKTKNQFIARQRVLSAHSLTDGLMESPPFK